ncbi:MAG: type I secretion system permease/ATPase, partial [Pseudomonadota bacterium]
IDGMRKRGQTVVLVSHRVQAIQQADTLLYIERGVQRAFGPREEVLKLFQGGGQPPQRRASDPAIRTEEGAPQDPAPASAGAATAPASANATASRA